MPMLKHAKELMITSNNTKLQLFSLFIFFFFLVFGGGRVVVFSDMLIFPIFQCDLLLSLPIFFKCDALVYG